MNEEQQNYLIANIATLNGGISSFFELNSDLNKTDSKLYLLNKLLSEIVEESHRETLYNKLKDKEFKKTDIVEIANEFGYYKEDLKKFYRQLLLQRSFEQNKDEISNLTSVALRKLKENFEFEKEFKFIETDYKKILEKALYVVLKSGFTENLTNVNSGVMVANAGDAAEFLFVARAMLAGYNCSSVDVRSSRYDSIIDFEGTLLRVQIKGIGSDNQVHFKDRDRGGQGIDHTHERNRGQRITSEDCDIYVAVDKQIGIVYIIPMYDVDLYSDDDLTKSTSDLDEYKENWNIVHEVVEHKRNS